MIKGHKVVSKIPPETRRGERKGHFLNDVLMT